jgi:hypothetical protein
MIRVILARNVCHGQGERSASLDGEEEESVLSVMEAEEQSWRDI